MAGYQTLAVIHFTISTVGKKVMLQSLVWVNKVLQGDLASEKTGKNI